ncbi:RHS repeat-associated core domain-containing protein [Catellatospora coxensis]
MLDVAEAAAVPGAGLRSAQSTPSRVRVQVLDRATSARTGVDGPVIAVQRADGATTAGRIRLALGYAAFAHAAGGDFGARLRLVALPSCAMVEPDRDDCRRWTAVASVNDARSQTVSADIDAAQGFAAYALTSQEASAQGDYRATALAPSSSWSTALSSGGFSWKYPMRVPGTPGGLNPTLELAYSSQDVDGRNSATNNQGSWIGEGFTYEPGYIERKYKPCSEDGHDESSDQCWAFQNGTVSLAGHSGSLVKIDDDTWKLSTDDGSKVERVTGAVNGDNDGEYWTITTVDGMRYFFGKNRLPGWTAGKEETESVWSVPVYGDDSGEPCNRSSGFADSYCDQAWRWNLDYVVDTRGNVISYFYDRETNHFARGGRTDVDGTAYDRGGYLSRIDYGQRDNEVYSTNAPARVVFSAAERCIPGGGVDCDPQDLNADTAASWPDVPQDLLCAAGVHCDQNQTSATYFTRKRLAKVQTEIRGASGWAPVESWTLEHEFKVNDDNSRTLWLKKIGHTGHQGATPQSLPAVELDGIQLANRIDRDDDDFGPLIRYRLASVKTDSGAQITVNYQAPDCTKEAVPSAGNSTGRCYPVIWNPLGGGEEDEVTDWFHKYVVHDVVVDDLVGGNDDMVTSYEYVGAPAWRKTEPDGITKTEDLTWSDWRGYAQVIARTGDGQSMPGRTDHYFLRGMSAGKKADGTSPAVTVADSTGAQYTDRDEWSGHELETIAYNGSQVVSKTINQPWSHTTRTQTETWGTVRANLVGTGTVRELTALADDAQGQPRWRETQTVTRRDTTWGRVYEVDDLGEVGQGKDGDDRCTRTTYADNPDAWLYGLVSRVWSVSVKCSVTDPLLSQQLISDSRTSYDLLAWNAKPTKGVSTRTETLDRVDGTEVKYLTESETTVLDGYGRMTSAKDALGYSNGLEYTSTNGLTTQTRTINKLGHAITTTIDPAFGVPTRVVDNDGKRTDLAYDALGRMTAVWLPNRDRDQGATPNVKFGYRIRTDGTTVVTTEQINNDGSYRPTYELFDGMLRLRQAQQPGPGESWQVTDTFYDGRGNAFKSNEPYLALGAAGDVPLVTPEGAVNGQHTLTYDGNGRQVADTFSVAGDVRWVTTTSYEGDRTHVDPPVGGVPTTSVTDGRGNVTELHQYQGSGPSGPADVTHYTFTPAGSLKTVTDPLGNVWTYHYNLRQLKESVDDPDSGTRTFTYDAVGQVTSTTDANQAKTSYRYDKIGRKTEMWQGDLDSGTKLAAWVYDSAGNTGQLYYSQRIVAGASYFTINMTRDALGRPTKVRHSFPAGGSGGVGSLLGKSYDITTAYNTDGTVQSVGMPAAGGLAAEAVASTYDTLQRPVTLTGLSSYVTASLYGNQGELLQAELFTGGTGKKAWLSWEYERGTGRVVRSKLDRQGVAGPDMDARYGYDDSGNILSIADAPESGARDVQCFGYDYLRRLTEAWATGSGTKTCADGVGQTGVGGPAPYHHSWTFDKVGNRDTETIHSLTGGADTERDYTYPDQGTGPNQPHALLAVAETGPAGNRTYQYDYDNAGNVVCRPGGTATNNCGSGTQSGHQTLTWDAEGRLATSTPAGGQPTSYVYDADGNRIARKEPNGATTIYLPGMELAQTGTVVSGTRTYVFGGRNVAIRTTSGVSFQAGDHHGTSSCAIDANTGALTWRRVTPYGASRGAAPTAWPDQKGFVGGTQDPTGLTHLGAREYDPLIGRFVSPDPIMDLEDPQQWQAYGYSNNTPVTMSDPTGLLGSASCKPGEVGGPGACTGTENTSGGGKQCASVKECEKEIADQSTDPCVKAPDSGYCKALKLTIDEIRRNSVDKRVQSLHTVMTGACMVEFFVCLIYPTAKDVELAYLEWYELVKAGGVWDHKPQMKALFGNKMYSEMAGTGGMKANFDIFSNIHYGYVGKVAGFSDEAVQFVNKYMPDTPMTGKRENGDLISTQIGIDLQARYKPEQITTALLHQAIMSRVNEYLTTPLRDNEKRKIVSK